MKTEDCFRYFTEEEMSRGAELFFSGDLENIKIQHERPERISGMSHRLFPKEGTVSLSCQWSDRSTVQRAVTRKCSIRFHEQTGVVCETSCVCDEYQNDLYGCPHTAGLFSAYLVHKYGEDVFRNTRMESLLSEMTGAEDPFLPGALKRTDGRLLSLLRGNEPAPLPEWKELAAVSDPIRLQCGLAWANTRMLLSLRIGYGKRMLVVKDIPDFLQTYQNGGEYRIGKSEFQLSYRSFEAQSAALMEFMSGLYSAADKGMLRSSLFTESSMNKGRYMILSGPEFDSFMELCDQSSVWLNDTVETPVSLERKGLKAVLRKKAYGAVLKIEPAKCIYAGNSYLYLMDREGIFRTAVESTEKTQELRSLLEWCEEELYIRESEIGMVCRNLMPVFRRYGTVITKGMELEDYGQESPEFEFDLDYSKDQILTCAPFAIYKNQEAKYRLYDPHTGAGRRNAEEEAKTAQLLPEIFTQFDRNTGVLSSKLDEEELYDFMKEYLPKLEILGKVMATDAIKRNRIRSLPTMRVGVSTQSGHLLLSLSGTGLSPLEMSDILGSYQKKKRYFRLKSGEFLSLEGDRNETWDMLSGLYRDYGQKDPEHVKIPAFRALYLEELLKDREDTVFEGDEKYRKLILDMDPSGSKKDAVPKSLRKIIRPYQEEGFRWIRMLKRCGFGGILADDMGLGKTLQVLSYLLSEKEAGKKGDELRTLVVCPASLVYNWKKEIEKYVPSMTCVVIAGNAEARRELILSSPDTDIWITSYDLLKRDIEQYQGIHFANEVADEAQFVKNQKTQAAQAVRVVESAFRLALTGTPIENYLSELWSIMDYLMPGFLFTYSRFQKEYETPVVAGKDEGLLIRLRKMVHPFILRRLKKQVLKELPDKLNETVAVRLEGEQKKLYDATTEEIRLALDQVDSDEFKKGKLEFLSMLTRLRQLCCDPALLYENYKGESAKLEACLELVTQAVDGGHKLLLFSQFTSMLNIIEARIKEEGMSFYRIDGGVSKEKRMQMVDSFANDDVKIFLISLKAGGTGLNLTSADIVIHYDPWWNQAAQNQATDRTHRIGQTKNVTVYELIAEDTVEEKIQKIKESKSRLVEDVLSGDEIAGTAINREDLLELLR